MPESREGSGGLIYLTLIRMPVNWSAEEGMSMADGSMRPMRNYADKVFDQDARLAHMTDGRVDPIPLWEKSRQPDTAERGLSRAGTARAGPGTRR